MIVNKSTLAVEMGVTTETINQWQKQGMPVVLRRKGSKGSQYDLLAVERWHHEKESTGKPPTDIDSERLRKIALEADGLAIELARKRGELVPSDQIENEWAGLIMKFRAKILAMPSRLAHQILASGSPAEAEAMLRAGLHEALLELSEASGTDDGEPEGLPSTEAAPESDGERLGGHVPPAQPRKQRRARAVAH